MGKITDDKVIKEILERIEKLENKIEQTNDKINKIVEHLSSLRQVRGGIIDFDARKKEIHQLLAQKKVPLSADELSSLTGFSRSHISSILNELFREGKVKKYRTGKIVKYMIVEEKK